MVDNETCKRNRLFRICARFFSLLSEDYSNGYPPFKQKWGQLIKLDSGKPYEHLAARPFTEIVFSAYTDNQVLIKDVDLEEMCKSEDVEIVRGTERSLVVSAAIGKRLSRTEMLQYSRNTSLSELLLFNVGLTYCFSVF